MLCQGTHKYRDHIRPSPGLGYRFETELSIKNMQITLFRDDEHMVGLDVQSFRDQFYRHRRVTRKNLVKQGGYLSQEIDNQDSNTHISRQILQQPGIGVEPTGRTSHTKK